MSVKLVGGLIIAGLIIIFTLQNTQVVEIRLFFWKVVMSRALMIFIILAVGVILGWILRTLTIGEEDENL